VLAPNSILMSITASLKHRGGWFRLVDHPYPDPSLFRRLGGQAVVDSVVDRLYDGIESDDILRPLFRHDLNQERANQKEFFARWMGGETVYHGYRGVRTRHKGIVSRDAARRWLGHFTSSLKVANVEPALVKEVMQVLVPLANSLIEPGAGPPTKCTYRQALQEAAKGDLKAFQQWTNRHPELLVEDLAQAAMHHACRRGQRKVVEYLLESGVDINLPHWSTTEVAVTPYALARAGRHHELADDLLARGALIDVFTLVWLGDLTNLIALLDAEPELVNANEPSQDFEEMRVLDHAVIRGKAGIVELVLDRGAELSHKGDYLVTRAVAKKKKKVVKLLLERGASAQDVSPGPWLIDEELRPLLLEHGAEIAKWGADWLELCTGHHGNREQPKLIEALLDSGADLEARSHKQRTALHCATRVGYTRVMKVLLEAGADIQAVDEEGNTPLHYVSSARPSADKKATAKVLLDFGASREALNNKGSKPNLGFI
jgi:ankyrin repeat protein/truncated hemoglobin YjbI